MPRIPTPRRRVAGVSLLAVVIVLAVLYGLRRIPPQSPESGRKLPAGPAPGSNPPPR